MKTYLFICLALASCSLSFSQARENDIEEDFSSTPFKDRIYTGGGLSLAFGNFTNISVSPLVGYRITKDFSAGVGAKYIYQSIRQSNFRRSFYGPNVFTRYQFLESFLAHVELEAINTQVPQPISGELKREWVPIALTGLGFTRNIGGAFNFNVMILYDIIGDPNSPYRSFNAFGDNSRFIYRGGVTLGL